MKKSTTQRRLKQLMLHRNLRQIDIVNMAQANCEKYGVKLTKTDLTQYVSGKTEPNQRKLFILSLTLDVNEAWLMGYDVPMERKRPTEESSEHLDEYIELFQQLSPEQQSLVISMIKGILSNQ